LIRTPAPKAINFDTAVTASNPGAAATSNYAAALKTYVDDRGMVNYRALQADRAQLDAFAASVGRLDLKVYEGWEKPEKIAFLINAYNALTLEAILANYPIKPSVTGAMLYPIKQHSADPGRLGQTRISVAGQTNDAGCDRASDAAQTVQRAAHSPGAGLRFDRLSDVAQRALCR
jgi:hypothetical protein